MFKFSMQGLTSEKENWTKRIFDLNIIQKEIDKLKIYCLKE